ncbi:MAG: ABC transporter substrate-binding protein [Hyphomicrobiaceae bacterium]|nr:MAG: ABC transporter substrate-binding protein [Hyphomicrobiaceae bacterium]
MDRRHFGKSLLVGAAIAAVSPSAWGQSSDPIIFGMTFDAAKQASYYALLMRDATILRIEEINAAGGVLGRQIKLLMEDDENNPAIAAQKVEKLASAGALFIFEVGSSATGLAAQRAAEELKVPNGSPTNVAEALTKPHKNWYFRLGLRDSIATEGLIRHLKTKFDKPRLAVIRDGTETGLSVSDNQVKFLTEAGFEVVAKEQISPGSVDVTAQALRIKAANPGVVLVTGASVGDLNNYIKSHTLLGNKAPMIGNNLFAVTTFPQLAGKAADGFMFVDAVDMARPDVKAVESKLMARYADRAKGSSQMIAAYDFVDLVVDGLKRAGTADRAKLRDALEATANWKSLVGRTGTTVSFSPTNHDGIVSDAQVVIRLVKDGQFAGSVE